MGISDNYARDLINDPDGSKLRARKDSYRGKCQRCDGPTDGSNGAAKAPALCQGCYVIVHQAEHGTTGRYQAGCSCDDCRAANREKTRRLRGKPPLTHGVSGYTNYRCRCEVCTEAWRHNEWLRYDVKKQQRVA